MPQIKNVYLFAGEHYMAAKNMQALIEKTDIAHPQLNSITFMKMPNIDELAAACDAVPLMSAQRVVIVRDGSIFASKGSAAQAKKLADYLDDVPSSTVLIFCIDEPPDKRRALYKKIKQMGAIAEFAVPKHADCTAFAVRGARRAGKTISRAAAQLLVDTAGCDYHTIENEIAKLAVYSDEAQIDERHVAACASRSLEYNVFEIGTLLAQKKTKEAHTLLGDIMQTERPEVLIGIFARKMRDMYKCKAMRDAGFSNARISKQLALPGFVSDRLVTQSARFSQESLRSGLQQLASLDYDVKSGRADASLALPAALVKIYQL